MAMTSRSPREAQTPIRNQGSRPTCAVFAVTGAHEWMRADPTDLSEESALWSAKRLDGNDRPATSVVSGLQGISNDGQAREKDWPYGNPLFSAGPPASAANDANRMKPGAWRSLGRPTVQELRAALNGGEAVILSLNIAGYAWSFVGADGFIDAPPGEPIVDGHTVLAISVVAWTSAVDAVEFKNSWGERWGDRGYGFLAETYWSRYGKRAFALAA